MDNEKSLEKCKEEFGEDFPISDFWLIPLLCMWGMWANDSEDENGEGR